MALPSVECTAINWSSQTHSPLLQIPCKAKIICTFLSSSGASFHSSLISANTICTQVQFPGAQAPTNEFCNKLVPSLSLVATVVITKAQIASLAIALEREKKKCDQQEIITFVLFNQHARVLQCLKITVLAPRPFSLPAIVLDSSNHSVCFPLGWQGHQLS